MAHMMTVLITSVVLFIATSLDDLVFLLLFLGQAVGLKERRAILLGHLMAISLLLIISMFGAYFAIRILEDWVIGLLGFIPILLAIKAMRKEDDSQQKEIPSFSATRLSLTVALVLLASGSDNVGMYIPYFATLSFQELFIVIPTFLLMVFLFFFIAHQIVRISTIKLVLIRFSQILVPLVFFLLGGSIIAKMGTLNKIMHLFSQ